MYWLSFGVELVMISSGMYSVVDGAEEQSRHVRTPGETPGLD